RYPGRVELVVGRVRPAAARAFVEVPLRTIRGRLVPMDAVAPRLAERLAEELDGHETQGARVRVLSSALTAWIADARPLDPVVESAAAELARSEGRVEVAPLAASLGVSARG